MHACMLYILIVHAPLWCSLSVGSGVDGGVAREYGISDLFVMLVVEVPRLCLRNTWL